MTRECFCSEAKSFRVTYDGGDLRNYTVDLCSTCFEKFGTEWLIKKEKI